MKGKGTAKRAPVMERVALNYLVRKASAEPPPEDVDGVHVLNPEERSELRGIERWMVIRAAIAGALSGLIAALAEVQAGPLLGVDPDAATMGQQLDFWLLVGPVIGIATVFEIGFLYWDALRSVHSPVSYTHLTLPTKRIV